MSGEAGPATWDRSRAVRRAAAFPAIGIDFSGAARAGRKVWIAELSPDGAVACERADRRLGCSDDRASTLASLVEFLRHAGRTRVGCDFPFGIHRRLVERSLEQSDDQPIVEPLAEPCADAPDARAGRRSPPDPPDPRRAWRAFVERFPQRFATPEALRDWCFRAAGDAELRRRTDRTAAAPMAPTNLRLYRQTYFGIRDVVRPLLRSEAVAFPPMAPRPGGGPRVFEVCPACTLTRLVRARPDHTEEGDREVGADRAEPDAVSTRRLGLGLDLTLNCGATGRALRYKGRAAVHRRTRRRLLDAFVDALTLRVDSSTRRRIVDDPEGDALDALIAAFTARTLRVAPVGGARTREDHRIEGRIYLPADASSSRGAGS